MEQALETMSLKDKPELVLQDLELTKYLQLFRSMQWLDLLLALALEHNKGVDQLHDLIVLDQELTTIDS